MNQNNMDSQSNFNPNNMVRVNNAPISVYKSSATWVIPVCSILLLIAIPSLSTFLSSSFAGKLHFLDHTTMWVFVSPLLLVSIILSALNIKIKGYQPAWEKWTMIGLTVAGVLLCLIPPVASMLYGSGIGS